MMPTPVKPHERTKSGMNWRYRTEVGVKLPTALKTTKSVEGSVQSHRSGWGGGSGHPMKDAKAMYGSSTA